MDRVTERPPGVDRPLGIDLFCGLGGLSLGMRMAGIEPAVGVDSWSAAVEAYSRNFPGAEFIVADVGDKRFQKELVKRWRGKAFVVCGGVPCQPFSVRNTKTKTGSGMPVEFAALACRLRPQYVVMEEVQSIATMEVAPGVSYLKAVEEVLRKRGYDVESRLLDASEHGVPQRRKRWFVVGRRRGPGSGATPVFPEPRKSAPIPVGSVISPPHPRVTPHAEDMIKRVLNGTAPYDMGYRVMNAGAPSPTLTTRFNDPRTWYSIQLPGSEWHGRVTVPNGLAIQGFPREWALSGRVMTDRKLVGNAVPPELGRRVFEQLAKDPRSFTHPAPGRTGAGA